jgi:hypothetical protein
MASSGARTRRLWAAFLRCKLPVKARMVLATLVYAAVTAAVWQHYFNKRLDQMRSMYRAGTNLGQKHWVPPPVYATKHSILLTMAVIPLTMCRKTIGVLSSTPLNRYLPLDSMTEVHRALGVWMIGQTLFAGVAFVMQYGSLCVLFARGWEEVGTAASGTARPSDQPHTDPPATFQPLSCCCRKTSAQSLAMRSSSRGPSSPSSAWPCSSPRCPASGSACAAAPSRSSGTRTTCSSSSIS